MARKRLKDGVDVLVLSFRHVALRVEFADLFALPRGHGECGCSSAHSGNRNAYSYSGGGGVAQSGAAVRPNSPPQCWLVCCNVAE